MAQFSGWRSPLALGVLPVLASRLTAPEPNYWGPWFHYNGTVTVVLSFALLDALRKSSDRRLLVRVVVAFGVGAALVLSHWAPSGAPSTPSGETAATAT